MTLAPRIPLPQVDRRGGRQPFSTCGEGEDAHENEGQRWREPRSAIHHDREKGSLSRGLQRDLSLSLALLLCFGGRTVNGATPARVSRFVISFISTKERRRSCASGVSASAAGEEEREREKERAKRRQIVSFRLLSLSLPSSLPAPLEVPITHESKRRDRET